MEYRIEKMDAIRLTGIDLKVNNKEGKNLRDVPQFWETAMKDGRYAALAKKAGRRLGLCGVCRDFVESTGDFIYSIAIETPSDRSGLPADCVDFEVPASTWAKFTARGPLHPNLQDTLKRIWSEWFPTSGREHAGTAELEYYSDGDPNSKDYWCEYWMPLK